MLARGLHKNFSGAAIELRLQQSAGSGARGLHSLHLEEAPPSPRLTPGDYLIQGWIGRASQSTSRVVMNARRRFGETLRSHA
jgi:hypothetical protein